MVLVNYTTRELTAKLVYYGPGLCGKTTNLQYVYESLLPPDRRGKMVSLATETDRTLFFDFLPLEIGTIRNLKTRLQLYTVPGQVHYNATRKIVLKGADGIVFVADSQRSMKQANIESFQNMKENLIEHGLNLADIPHVIQFNKRDLPDVMTIEEMFEDLNGLNAPFWEAVAVQGVGVEDTLKSVTKLVLKHLARRFAPDGVGEAQAPQAEVAAPVAAQAVPATPEPIVAEPIVAEPIPAEASPFGEEAPFAAPESPLMTSTGELLALEFDGGGGTPIPRTPPPEDDEILEVGEDALLLEDEPTRQQPAVAPPEAPAPGGAEPFGLEAEPFGLEAEPPGQPAVADDAGMALDGLELGTPLTGVEPGAAPPAPPPPEAAVADDAASALDGLELGTPLTGVEPGAALREAPEIPLTSDGDVDAGATIVMPSEVAPPDMEMPGLDSGADAGDTVLSPIGDLEGLATEADLPADTPALDDAPLLDDIPEVPGMDGPPPPLVPETAPELPAAPVTPESAVEVEMAALVQDEEVVDLPTTLSLGAVQGDVEKTLRLPIEWTDASGQSRSRSLEIKLRFKLD